MENDLKTLKEQAQESINEHDKFQSLDSFLYNASVIVAIVFTATATLLPESFSTIGKILTGIAAIIITLDRSLNWGGRWLYHRQLRHKYLNISSRVSLFENLTPVFSEEEKKKYFLLIYDDLFLLRREEFSVPGVEGQKKK